MKEGVGHSLRNEWTHQLEEDNMLEAYKPTQFKEQGVQQEIRINKKTIIKGFFILVCVTLWTFLVFVSTEVQDIKASMSVFSQYTVDSNKQEQTTITSYESDVEKQRKQATALLSTKTFTKQSFQAKIGQLNKLLKEKQQITRKIAGDVKEIIKIRGDLSKKTYTTQNYDYWNATPQRIGHIKFPINVKGEPDDFNSSSTPIDVRYPEGEYYPLPVNFLRQQTDPTRQNGTLTIADVLYAENDLRKQRKSFHINRYRYIHQNKNIFNSTIHLAKFNNALDRTDWRDGIIANQQDWLRLNNKFGFDKITKELPMCLIVPGYKNNDRFRIEHNLNSIFAQNYTNYFVVIIDDHSKDESLETYSKYFAFHRIDKKKYVLLENRQREGALHNIYINSMKYCSLQSIVLNIDGDDELIGRNVLQLFNWAYQTYKAGVIYSNYIDFGRFGIQRGKTQSYTEQQKRNNKYRDVRMKFSHLRSYRNQLTFLIDPTSLQDEQGQFFKVAVDRALLYSIMELSCGRVFKIEDEFSYLYITDTGINTFNNYQQQNKIKQKTIKKPKSTCDRLFDERMAKL